jgi:low temperature requirement protein LtrA
MNPVYFLLLVALGCVHVGSVILHKRSGRTTVDADPTLFIEINALALIAVSFALASVLLVIVTSPALGRFMDAAAVFLPCILVRALANRIHMVRNFAG